MKKPIRMLTAMLLALILMLSVASAALAAPSRGNLVHFVPTVITVLPEKVKVEGCLSTRTKTAPSGVSASLRWKCT